MEDYLGEEAANVYTKNPKFPPHIAEYVMNRLKKIKGNENFEKFELVVDAGCGNGKSLLDFLPFFQRSIGFDVNENQVRRAKESIKSETATFYVGIEESMLVEDKSVDLLLNVGALHFMDLATFLKECRRVLKSTGLCATYDSSFSRLEVHFPVKNANQKTADGSGILTSYRTTLYRYYIEANHPTAEWLNRYEQIYERVTGFNKERNDDVTYDYNMTLKELKMFFLSFPTFRKHHNLFGEESAPLNIMGEDLKKLVNAEGIDDEKLQLRFTLSMFFLFLYN
ncbi:uncharacterized protein LOC120338042 [Styela clava]|uniref:uncharacterized protein LOC120338042 n=1 Tax=Styela clava TaxID=7725 RepID=UPI001939C1C9|nr:uncharacterized protein LOC120338042 [Styela clava]